MILLAFLVFFVYILLKSESNYGTINIPQPGQESPKKIEYIFENNNALFPENIEIYKFKTPYYESLQQIERLKNYFNIKNTTTKEDKDKILILSEKKVIEIDKNNGYFSYINNEKLYNNKIYKNIPTDSEAIEIAKKFLIETKLFSGRFQSVSVTAQKAENEAGETVVMAKDVWFYPVVNGRPIYGISRIIVTIGNKGEIEAVCKYYRDFEFYKKEKLKSLEKAVQEIKEGRASSNIPPEATKAHIKKSFLGYWEDPEQQYLIPVYVFQGETAINNKIEKFDIFTPAIENVELVLNKNIDEEYFSTQKD